MCNAPLLVAFKGCARCPETKAGTLLVLTRLGWLCGPCYVAEGRPCSSAAIQRAQDRKEEQEAFRRAYQEEGYA